MFINTISSSKSDIIEECLLKYKRKYIERLPGYEKKNQETLNFGSFIHKIFELGYRTNSTKDLLKLAESEKSTYKIKASYADKIKICIENFIKFNSQLSETISTELSYEVDLDEKYEIKATGIIDRIVKGSNGGILIIDYKTSKREKKRHDLQTDKQLMGYAYAVHKIYGIPFNKIHCAHFYPITGNFASVQFNKIQIWNWKKGEIEKVWRVRKKKSEEFPPMRNMFCDYCEFQKLCPVFEDEKTVTCRLEEQKALKKRLDEEEKKGE